MFLPGRAQPLRSLPRPGPLQSATPKLRPVHRRQGSAGGFGRDCGRADLDGNGDVDWADLALFPLPSTGCFRDDQGDCLAKHDRVAARVGPCTGSHCSRNDVSLFRIMPDLFENLPLFAACALIMAVAQLIYATVGFGAGMFAVALLALLLSDLTGVVVVLLILTLVTEVWVLARTWRQARIRLLGWLVPGMIVGLWLGTKILVTTDVSLLKQFLGVVVAGAGLYFILEYRARHGDPQPIRNELFRAKLRPWVSLPVGLLSGLLGGLFGTGGPPVIIFLRVSRLDKGTFRSTILAYFLLMSLLRAGTYAGADLLTVDRAVAAACLLPGSVAGIILGMIIHNRISERQFSQAVSVLLVLLGVLLVAGAGR